MTLPRVSDLTDEQVRVMVCTASGIYYESEHIDGSKGFRRTSDHAWFQKDWLPNYPVSLDAMAPVLASMRKDTELSFRYWGLVLPEIVGLEGDEKNGHWCSYWAIGTATAREHCNAFLVCRGKATL